MLRKLLAAICVIGIFCLGALCKEPPEASHTPSIPSEPTGPSVGMTDSAYSFQTCSTDPDDDQICYRVLVGESDTSAWSNSIESGDTFVFSLAFDAPDTYTIRAQAKNSNDSISGWSGAHLIVITHGPNREPAIDGFFVIPVQFTTLKYQSRAYPRDPDGDAIRCRWDWGDGDTTAWTSPVAPGYYWSPWGYQYPSPGSYSVRAQARDTWGLLSSWTEPKTVVANDPDPDFPYKDSRRFDLPLGATSIVMHPSGDHYFVAGRRSGVAAVSATGDTALDVARVPSAGSDDDEECPLGMSPDGSVLYITSERTGQLWKIRSDNMTVTDSVSLSRPLYDLAVSVDGQQLYVTSDRTLLVLSASTLSVEDTAAFATALSRVVVNPSGAYIYLGSWSANALYVVRTSDFATEVTLPIWCTQGMCVKPDGALLYVGSCDSTVAVVRTSDHSVVQTTPLIDVASSIAVTPDGEYVYANGEYCAIMRTSDNTVRGYTLDDKWYSVAFTPDGQTAYAVYSTTAIVLTP